MQYYYQTAGAGRRARTAAPRTRTDKMAGGWMNGRVFRQAAGLLCALGVLAWCGGGWAGEELIAPQEAESPEPVLTLDQVLGIARVRNPVIDASRGTVDASRARVTQAQSAYMPQVSGNAQYDYAYQYFGPGVQREQLNTYQAVVSGSQFIYGFGKVTGAVRQSQEQLASSQRDLDATLADVLRDVKGAFFDVLKKQELVTVSREALDTQATHLEQARAFHRTGIRPKIDVTKGEVAWSQARLGLIQADYDLRLSRVVLENVLGGPPVDGPYALAGMTPEVVPRGPVDPLVDAAMDRRPEIRSQSARILAQQARIRTVKAQYWPSLTALGQFGWEDNDFPLHNVWLVGANLTWDFFPGLRTVGEVREARASMAVLQSRLNQLELEVVRQVSQAYLLLGEAAESIATAEVGLMNAEENMALAAGRYQNGVGDAIEYNDAVLSLTSARSDLVRARYDYLDAQAELERAVGMPYQELWQPAGEGPPREPVPAP